MSSVYSSFKITKKEFKVIVRKNSTEQHKEISRNETQQLIIPKFESPQTTVGSEARLPTVLATRSESRNVL